MHILLVGCGTIGSVYGGHLALAGHELRVLSHGEREAEVEQKGIRMYDTVRNQQYSASVKLARPPDERRYDLVIVAVRAEQLPTTFDVLRKLKGAPHLLFIGNNPDGHKALPPGLPGSVQLAFPGISGGISNGIVQYEHIPQQPTTIETSATAIGKLMIQLLKARGFKVKAVDNMDGWLAYHAIFISCVAAALQKVRFNAQQLSDDAGLLRLMCHAIEEGFGALRRKNFSGLPTNLAILHHPLLRPIAVAYWRKVMPKKGEAYFGIHLGRTADEVRALRSWVLNHVDADSSDHIRRLLTTV